MKTNIYIKHTDTQNTNEEKAYSKFSKHIMTERFVGDTGYMVLLINELRITNAYFIYLHNLTSSFLSDEVSNW